MVTNILTVDRIIELTLIFVGASMVSITIREYFISCLEAAGCVFGVSDLGIVIFGFMLVGLGGVLAKLL